jgi:hypothetical protein
LYFINERNMNPYQVTVRTPASTFAYTALAVSSCAAWEAAIDHFGVCAVTVTPSQEAA